MTTHQEEAMRGPRPGDLPAGADWQDGRCDEPARAKPYDPHATCRDQSQAWADAVARGQADPCDCGGGK